MDAQDPKALLDMFIINKILNDAGDKLMERRVKSKEELINTAMFKAIHSLEDLAKSSSFLAQTTVYEHKNTQ